MTDGARVSRVSQSVTRLILQKSAATPHQKTVFTPNAQRSYAATKEAKIVFTTKDTKSTKFKNKISETFVSFVVR